MTKSDEYEFLAKLLSPEPLLLYRNIEYYVLTKSDEAILQSEIYTTVPSYVSRAYTKKGVWKRACENLERNK
jgi:hypothetical protein